MNNTLIQISRSQYIEKDRSIAILRLDQHLFEIGEPVQVRYYLDEEQTEVDTILAMGIRKGYGKDCYKVMSLGGLELVRDVVSELPDVSDLSHGEVYLYQDPADSKWYYVYEIGKTRQLEELVGSPRTFVNISNRYRYFWKSGELKREDDFYTTDALKGTIEEILYILHRPSLSVGCLSGNLFYAGTPRDLVFKIQVLDYSNKDITKECLIRVDDFPITLDENGYYIAENVQYNHDYKISATLEVNDSSLTVDSWIRIRFGYDLFFGLVSEDWELTEENIKSLDWKELSTRETIKKTGINLDNQKIIFATPQAYGLLVDIRDGEDSSWLGKYNTAECMIDGNMYYVYFLKSPSYSTNLTQRFLYSADDVEIELSYGEDLDAIIRAWKKQNMGEGLVVVEDNGKIPEYLIPESAINGGGYVPLIGFVDEYPLFGMNIGDTYYNKETKKLYVATASDSGLIKEPSPEKLYLNLREKVMYVWRDGDMDVVGGSIMSSKITDLNEILL